jgi:hypothetical protein
VVKPWPTILWLQGGPGGSASGRGNFLEIGPLDLNMNPRNFTWLSVADIIFVVSEKSAGTLCLLFFLVLLLYDSTSVLINFTMAE